jgi:hypothetical protein
LYIPPTFTAPFPHKASKNQQKNLKLERRKEEKKKEKRRRKLEIQNKRTFTACGQRRSRKIISLTEARVCAKISAVTLF